MNTYQYKSFFPGERWEKFVKKFVKKLEHESANLTCLPGVGKKFHLKLIKENYNEIRPDDPTKVIFIELIKEGMSVSELDSLIKKEIKAEVKVHESEDMNSEELIRVILRKGKRLLIIINKIENIKDNKESLSYLEFLRSIDSFNVRFLIGCDISCLTSPLQYKAAGGLMISNIVPLPVFTEEETSKLLNVYGKENTYEWKIEKTLYPRIFKLSGGIPTLIKYVAKFAHDNNSTSLDESKLLSDPAISFRLREIKDDLKKHGLLNEKELDLTRRKILTDIGVLNEKGEVGSKLLELFLIFQDYESFDLEKELSSQEFHVFQVIQKSSPALVSLDTVAKEIWGSSANVKFSMWAIYKIISNINKKIKRMGYEIKNYRGRGYALTEIK